MYVVVCCKKTCQGVWLNSYMPFKYVLALSKMMQHFHIGQRRPEKSSIMCKSKFAKFVICNFFPKLFEILNFSTKLTVKVKKNVSKKLFPFNVTSKLHFGAEKVCLLLKMWFLISSANFEKY